MTASTPAQALPANMPGQGDRPQWSAAEAARRCGVGRATIQRALTEGRLAGAVQTERGWRIPLEALLAAGFVPSKPAAAPKSPPGSPDRTPARGHALDMNTPLTETARRITQLEAEVLTERARAEVAVTRQSAAETLASERLGHVEDLRAALRVLESASKPPTPDAPTRLPPVGNQVANPSAPVVKTGWWHRRREQ